jgi:hypothetical protein
MTIQAGSERVIAYCLDGRVRLMMICIVRKHRSLGDRKDLIIYTAGLVVRHIASLHNYELYIKLIII